MLEIKKTQDVTVEPCINMLIYGPPGVGKTTFACGTDKVLIGDVEGGAVFLGMHGIQADYASISKWSDLDELYKAAKDGGYKTVVIDPLGELLDKLIGQLKTEGYGQGRGENTTLALQGWGIAKERFKSTIRKFRDLNINLVLVAHSNEKKDEELTTVRPKLQASLDEDVCSMMQVVGFLKNVAGKDKSMTRRLYLNPTEKYYAKDRIGVLPPFMDNVKFEDVRKTITSNEFFSKMLVREKKADNFLPKD
jgi:phage nucleotide-binding protein